MLKIQDASGEVVGVLKDEDASPKMTNKLKKEEVKLPETKEGDSK